MEIKVQIPFQQLLAAIRTLSSAQKARLQKELAAEKIRQDDKAAFIEMLLAGPIYTDKEIATIEENRKSIAQWRIGN